jgi:hypothetical protein
MKKGDIYFILYLLLICAMMAISIPGAKIYPHETFWSFYMLAVSGVMVIIWCTVKTIFIHKNEKNVWTL